MGGIEGAFRHTLLELLEAFAARVTVTLLTTPTNHASFDGWCRRFGARLHRVRVFVDPTDDFARELPEHDVLWCPFFELDPPDAPIPAVVTIPDLQHVAWPEFFSRDELAARIRKLRPSAARAARVLTNSVASQRDLCRVYHLPESHVVVTHLDCARAFRAPASAAAVAQVRARHGLPDRFALYPANCWPHKNHRGLFAAWAAYRARHGEPPRLVLTGVRSARADWLQAEQVALGLGGAVQHLGFVDAEDLPALYDAATCVVFPSLFEGFGIPVVEAMRRGRPLVASNTTSVPEIAGESAWLVDPTDPVAIADAVHEILGDPEAAERRGARGRQEAERFSYRATAERSLMAFEAAALEVGSLGSARVDAVAKSGDARPVRSTVAVAADARPRVFVVTPSFNQGRFLRATIDSVLAQDYPALDYFVADGGSTDESLDILRSYGDRVRWRSGPDGGQAAAIHEAWRQTDAEVVAWLNSDDTYLPGAVSRGVNHLLEHPDHAMVYGKAWYTDIDGALTEPYPTRPVFDREAFAGNCYICQPATFVRREVFEVIDLPDVSLRFAMDYDLWIRLSQRFEVGYLDEFLATSRMYADNKTLGERDGVFREIHEVVRRHYGRVDRDWKIGFLDYRVRKVLGRFARALPRPVQQFCYRGAVAYRTWRSSAAADSASVEPLPPFADGWVGPVAQVQVEPDPDGRISLWAESPEWPYSEPLRVALECDGRMLGMTEVEQRGAFRIDARLPGASLRAARVVLRSERGFVPAECGLGDDGRRLAFRLLRTAPAD